MLPIKHPYTIKSPNGELAVVSRFETNAIINENEFQLIDVYVKRNKHFLLLNIHNRNFDKDKKTEYLKNVLALMGELTQYNQIVCGDFNQENLTFNNLTHITNTADFTWKKSENTTYSTKTIDYFFSSMPATGAY